MRIEIPIVLHRKALSNCGRYATTKKDRSVNLDRMYNNALASFNKKVMIPTGWIAWRRESIESTFSWYGN